MLIAVLAMLAVVLSSCKDDDPTVGIDSGMPAPSVFYDAANSAGKTIAVYWNPMQAISAGATSFTVQLVKSEDGAGDVYDNTISQTLASVDKDNQPADKAKFENLAKGRIYYVRVRANYPRSVYSPWILAASSEEDSTTARIKVGEGLVGPEAGESSDIETRFIGSTESSVSIAWSTCDTWTANDLDKSLPYRLELFADDKCTDLVVAWNAPANLPDGTSTKNAVFKLGTRFSFSNLNPETSYWARVTNTADNVVSEPVECKTGKSNYKAMPAAATVDEIILFQDFHELVYGGNPIDAAAGVSTTKKGSGEQFWPLRGDDPTKDTEKGLVLCSGDREIGLFNTLKSSVAASTTLQDWGRMYEDKSTTSKENGAICARQGLLKMGAGSYRGCVVTPELKCLTQPATIELSFKASAFDGGDENQTILVHLLDDTQIDGSYWVTAASKTQVGTGATGTKADGWKDFTFTIENVTATSRIAIGGENGGGSTQHRFLLDDIQIKLLSYGSVDVDLDAPVVTVESTPITITATWGAVQSARSYTVEYKKTANADWTLAGETGETSFKIENLDSETSYDVRVKATAGDSESEYSEIKSVTFIEAKLSDNVKLMSSDPTYLANLVNQSDEQRARDLDGNWKYKAAGDDIIKLTHMEALYRNSMQIGDGIRRVSCDAAFEGGDSLVMWLWEGWHIRDIFVCKLDSKKTVDTVKAMLEEWHVREECFTYDLNGLGQIFKGFFPNAIPFNNKEAVEEKFKYIYANLKSQAAYLFAQKIINREISIEPTLLERKFSGKGFEKVPLRQILDKERKAIRKDEDSEEKGWTIIKKIIMKKLVGHSPDFIEALLMRMIFEIKHKRKHIKGLGLI